MKQILNKYQHLLFPLMAALVSIAISYPLMGKYYLFGNKNMTTFGGDALIIYYDMLYYIKFGKDAMLSNMNYPNGEYIYLTDAQGALTKLLWFINKYLFKIEDYLVAIVHGLNMWSIPLGAIFLYYLFDYWKVNKILAAIFPGLILVLSPQFIRLGAHFGLAYLFIFPMCMLWFIRKQNYLKLEYRDLLVFLILMFFSFNNPYIGFGSTSLVITMSFVSYLNSRRLKSNIWIPASIAITSLLIAFITLKINDPFSDRIKLQWGFFDFKATLEGYIAPQGSLVDLFLRHHFGNGFKTQFESIQNVGAICILSYLTLLVISIMKKRKQLDLNFPKEFKTIFWAATFLFLYASAVIFLPFKREWIENKLGFLLMFKASGRIAWPFYYMTTIGAVLIIDRLFKKINLSFIKYSLLILVIATWLFEIKYFIAPNFDNPYSSNFLSKEALEKHGKFLTDNNINTNDFQAILQLPKTIFWSDKFRGEMNWFTQFHSIRTSLESGLPLTNAYLSRMSIGNTMEAIELISHPLIEKSLPLKYPNNKDLLIILGHQTPLSEGEQYLLNVSTKLLDTLDHAYYSLPLNKINEAAINGRNLFNVDSLKGNIPSYYNSFDQGNSIFAYYGKKSNLLPKGTNIIIDTIFNNEDEFYEFSTWVRVDSKRHGQPNWTIEVFNQDGNRVFDKYFQTNETPNVQDDWAMALSDITIPKGYRLKITQNGNQPFIIDELMIRNKSKNIILDHGGDFFTYNNIRIKKP